MFRNTILNAFVNQSFPNKCQTLNTILEECNPKECCSSFEMIVNCLFSDTAKINYICSELGYSSNMEHRISWPLKLVNRSQYNLEYDCIFKFLNSNSLFWLTIFRLDSMSFTFSLETSSLPPNLKYRIENGLSYLSSKVDAFNVLNLTALEFYLIHFLLVLYETKSNSRRLYNDKYGNIELDSVYADLFNDYLNFFLPVNERDVNFPTFTDPRQAKQDLSSSSLIPSHNKHHTSLLRHVVQKSVTEDSISILNEPDTISDMKKIDTFIRLFVDVLVNSFADTSEQQFVSLVNKNNQYSDNSISGILNETSTTASKSFLSKNLSFSSHSPVKLNDPKIFLANIETVFALSMTLKHFHLFSNAFPVMSSGLHSSQEINQLNDSLCFNSYRKPNKSVSVQAKSPIDELRMSLFKIYLRKPFYKFFQFHFEHWPLTPSIKWIIESWLTYIQPWKFTQTANQIKSQQLSSEFIKDNLLIYTDIYQLILKRYCIIDLTNEDNLMVLHRLLSIFYKQAQIINKFDNKFSSVQSQLSQMTKQECDQMIRQIPNFSLFINSCNEFDKAVYTYKPLNGIENLKQISSIYEALISAKTTLKAYLNQKINPQESFITSFYNMIFTSQQNKLFSNMDAEDLKRIICLIDEIDSILKEFYKTHSVLVFGAEEGTSASDINSRNEQKNKQLITPSKSIRVSPECELTNNGSVRLSPRGRFQIINRLCNPVIPRFYDPDKAPVGEFENRFLVYVCQRLANLINDKYGESFEEIYQRNDLIGRMGRKCLYGPNELSSNNGTANNSVNSGQQHMLLQADKFSHELNNPNLLKVRLSLRALANYRFVLYFSVFFFFVKTISGLSFMLSLLISAMAFFIHFLIKSN